MTSISIADKKPAAKRRARAKKRTQSGPVPLDPKLTADLAAIAEAQQVSPKAFGDALRKFVRERQQENPNIAQMLNEARTEEYQRGFDDGVARQRNAGIDAMPPAAAIGPRQCAAARALLGWSQTQLANAAGVGLSCVSGFETGRQEPRAEQYERIRNALELAGMEFLKSDCNSGAGSGVRWRTSGGEYHCDFNNRFEGHYAGQTEIDTLLDHVIELAKTAKVGDNG